LQVREAVLPASAGGAVADFAPGIMLISLMFGAIRSGQALVAEKERGTLKRMLTGPVRQIDVMLGKSFGTFLVTMLQAIGLSVALMLLFGAELGALGSLLIILALFILAVTALGLLLGALSSSSVALAGLTTLATLLCSVLGGNLGSTAGVPVVNMLRFVTPNYWASQAISALSGGAAWQDVWPSALVLVAMSLVLLGLGTRGLSRRLSAY
jgi:ABC-2 type transport system permease protein